jgi:PAS domain S-box-containing protein
MVPVHPDDVELVKQAYEKHKRGIPTNIEYRLRRRNGEIIWISDKSFPIRNERGQIYRVAGIAEDISARKNAEKALRESEEKYRKLIETTNEGIWIIDAKARTIYANQHTARLLGYGVEELRDRPIYDFLKEIDYEKAQTQMRLKPSGLKSQGEWLLKAKNDTDVWVMYCSNPMFDETGQFSGALVMIMDITDRKRFEESLREKLSDVERSYKELKTQMKARQGH